VPLSPVGGKVFGMDVHTHTPCPAVVVAFMNIEALLRSAVILQSCDGVIQSRKWNDPITSGASPTLTNLEYDPHHVSDHGATRPGGARLIFVGNERQMA